MGFSCCTYRVYIYTCAYIVHRSTYLLMEVLPAIAILAKITWTSSAADRAGLGNKRNSFARLRLCSSCGLSFFFPHFVPSWLSLMSCSVSSGSGAACCLPLEWLHVLPPVGKLEKLVFVQREREREKSRPRTSRARAKVRDGDGDRLVAQVWAILARTLPGTWRVENTASCWKRQINNRNNKMATGTTNECNCFKETNCSPVRSTPDFQNQRSRDTKQVNAAAHVTTNM